jgi:rhodanese-related sulfurtransferase
VTIIHRGLAVVAATLACAAFIVDGSSGSMAAARADRAIPRFITAPELAARIMARDPDLRIFDLRSHVEYARFHVPSATRATIGDLTRDPFPPTVTAVLYANTLTHATRAWARLSERGLRDEERRRGVPEDRVFILRGGLYEWIARVHEPHLAVDATDAERAEFDRAVRLSRFFGGLPRQDVPRSEIPTGYWTGADGSDRRALQATLLAVAAIRRRGC